jgi:hypothetical protein
MNGELEIPLCLSDSVTLQVEFTIYDLRIQSLAVTALKRKEELPCSSFLKTWLLTKPNLLARRRHVDINLLRAAAAKNSIAKNE